MLSRDPYHHQLQQVAGIYVNTIGPRRQSMEAGKNLVVERTLIQVEGEKNDSILLVNTPVVRNAVCNKGRVDRIDQFPLIRNHRSPPNSSACGCPGRCRCHHPLRPQSQCQDRIRYGLDVPLPDERACSSPACQSSCHESRAR
jgi:hypothetical protein